MNPLLILGILALYFSVLILIAWYTSRGADTDSFFIGNRSSPWYLVAFGMLGTSISGVTFISVPGAVGKIPTGALEPQGFQYFQIVIGYIAGYWVIGTVLMPLYYRLGLVSIYAYLQTRFGQVSYYTGSAFFLLSRTIGSALRLYLAALVLDLFVFQPMGVPFWVTVATTIVLIWVYTFKGGIKTIVWTDSFQTFFLVAAAIATVIMIPSAMGLSFGEVLGTVFESTRSDIFKWENPMAAAWFPKQFLAGMFIAIVMTGLDQDLMQKNLSCKNLGEAQKNMFWFTLVMVFVTFVFLVLGAMLYEYAAWSGFDVKALSSTDLLYPTLALEKLGLAVGLCFVLGITASTYASSDSALTALTTAFCIDFLKVEKMDEAKRKKYKTYVHIGFSLLFFIIILIVKAMNTGVEVINTVLFLAAFTYGPLLGMFAYGLFRKCQVRDAMVPVVAILAPALTYGISKGLPIWFNGFALGPEIVLLNGALTFLGMEMIRRR